MTATEAPKVCPSCGAAIPAGALFCLQCGASSPTEIADTVAEMPRPAAPPAVDIPARMAELQAALGHGFKVEGLLGRGGFGEVWAVLDIQLGRTVAVKVLRSELFATASYRERFRREARAIAKLRHPGIVPIYHVGESNGLAYFVMPLVDGTTLKARLLQPGGVSPEEALRILVEAVAALREAHAGGIIHRDLKPENIMLEGPQGRVLLMDFGVAKTDEPDRDGLTEADTVLGSPEYMSPEQATGRALDGRSDIYSLGVVAYRMLAGKLPFDAETPREVLAHHVLTPPVPLETHVTLPGTLSATVMRCLAKNPDERWSSADELLAALSAKDLRRSLLAAAATIERREAPVLLAAAAPTSAARGLGPSRRRPAMVAALGVAVLLLLVSPWPVASLRVQRQGAAAATGIAAIYRNAADSMRILGRAFTSGALPGPAYAAARSELLLSADESAETAWGEALDDSLQWRPAARGVVATAALQLAASSPAVASLAPRPSDVVGCRLRSAGDTLNARDDVAGDNCWFQAVASRQLTAPVEYFASFRIGPEGGQEGRSSDAGLGLAWCRSDADCRVVFLWAASPMVWGTHRPHRGLTTLQLGPRARLTPGPHELRVRLQDDVLRVWYDGGVVLERPASADAAYFERGSSVHLVVQNASVLLHGPMAIGAAGTATP